MYLTLHLPKPGLGRTEQGLPFLVHLEEIAVLLPDQPHPRDGSERHIVLRNGQKLEFFEPYEYVRAQLEKHAIVNPPTLSNPSEQQTT